MSRRQGVEEASKAVEEARRQRVEAKELRRQGVVEEARSRGGKEFKRQGADTCVTRRRQGVEAKELRRQGVVEEARSRGGKEFKRQGADTCVTRSSSVKF